MKEQRHRSVMEFSLVVWSETLVNYDRTSCGSESCDVLSQNVLEHFSYKNMKSASRISTAVSGGGRVLPDAKCLYYAIVPVAP